MASFFRSRFALSPSYTPAVAGLTFITLAAFLLQGSLEDVERRLGPFIISGNTFNVVLHEKRVTGSPAPHLSQTLALLEIRDGSDNTSYQKSFPYQFDSGEFK